MKALKVFGNIDRARAVDWCTVLKPARQHQPGEPAVVAGDAAAAQEELVLQVRQQRQHDGAAVRCGPARQASHGAGCAHGRHVVVVAQVDHPVGDPAPDARFRWYTFCWVPTPPTSGIRERHLDGGEEAGLPGCVRVDQHEHFAGGLPDAPAQRRPLARVPEQDRPHGRNPQGADALIGLGVPDVEDDDDLRRVLGQPRLRHRIRMSGSSWKDGTTTEVVVVKSLTTGRDAWTGSPGTATGPRRPGRPMRWACIHATARS